MPPTKQEIVNELVAVYELCLLAIKDEKSLLAAMNIVSNMKLDAGICKACETYCNYYSWYGYTKVVLKIPYSNKYTPYAWQVPDNCRTIKELERALTLRLNFLKSKSD